MELIDGRRAQERAGRLIEDLFRTLDPHDADTLSRLERALRLWSECRIHPEMRLAVSGDPEPLPECDGVVLTAPRALPDDVKAYPVYSCARNAAPAYDRLPGADSQTVLFGADGLIRPDIARAGLEALTAHRTAFVLLSGGAGTRYADSSAALREARDRGALTDEQRDTLDIFRTVYGDVDECLTRSKLFAPMGCVTGRGPFEINMESIAELLEKTHDDVPVVVFVGDSTREDVERLLAEHGNFGIRRLAVIDQDMAPFVREEDGALLETEDGAACGANGGGGIVYSLGHARPTDVHGHALYDGTVLDWFDALAIDRIVFSQTDDAKRPEVYLGLCAAGAEDGVSVAASGSRYPTVMAGGKPFFRLGSLWSDGAGALCCTEFAELQPGQVDLLTRENHPDGYAVANTGLYLADIELVRRVIASGLLGIHFQRRKKERGADGQLHDVTKFEYFMPDLLGVASQLGAKCRIALLRDTANLTGPLRNLTVDALPAKDIYKLALAQLAKLYCDITLARAAGLTVEDGALIELGPFARIVAEPGARVLKGARLYVGGAAEQPVEAAFKSSARIAGDVRITSSQVIE